MMKKKIGKNLRYFKVIRSMDRKKVLRKLKERRQQRKKNRMVKEILGNMILFEILGLTAVLGMTIMILFVLYSSMKNFRDENMSAMQSLENIIDSMETVVYSVSDATRELSAESGNMMEIADALMQSVNKQEELVGSFETEMDLVALKADEN